MKKIPEDLFNLQRWMGAILTRPLRDLRQYRLPHYDEKLIAEIEEQITSGPSLNAAERMGIYNQQYWFRLFTLLQKDYPVLHRLFGPSDFNHFLAEPYLLKYPPNHWSLASLGSQLPLWIAEEYHEEDRNLIHQIALIEEAYERLLYTQPLPSLTKEELPSIANATLFLQPTLALFALEADLFTFRAALLEKEVAHWRKHPFPKIDWSNRQRFFILFPKSHELSYEEISPEEHLILTTFEKGAKIGEVLSLLQNNTEAIASVGKWFQKWGEWGWLTK